MQRRHYLALLAAVGTAGCSIDDLPVSSDTETPTETQTPQTQTQTPTETQTPETETPDETDTQTPEESEEASEAELRASQALRDADGLIDDAIAEYAAAVDAATIVAVRASDGPFSPGPVLKAIDNLGETLEPARENGNESQQRRADSLGRLGEFLRRAATTQSALGAAFESFPTIVEGFIEEDFRRISENENEFESDTASAEQSLQATLDSSEPADADASESLERSSYESKTGQLRSEARTFRALADELTTLSEGLRTWSDGVGRYLDERWTPARDNFEQAAETLQGSAGRLDTEPVGDDAVDEPFGNLREMALALGEASEHLAASASAYRTGDDDAGKSSLEDGQNRLDESEVVRRRVETAQDIIDFEGS